MTIFYYWIDLVPNEYLHQLFSYIKFLLVFKGNADALKGFAPNTSASKIGRGFELGTTENGSPERNL